MQTQDRVLYLGHSLSEFMRELGIYDSGGNPRLRLRNQMDRLFRCTVELSHRDETGERFVASRIADQGEFWWDIAGLGITVHRVELRHDLSGDALSDPQDSRSENGIQ